MDMSRDENAGHSQIYRLIIVPLKGGRVKMFGKNLKESKFYSEEIKRRLNSGDICYHSV
jgi:hypothetical protein